MRLKDYDDRGDTRNGGMATNPAFWLWMVSWPAVNIYAFATEAAAANPSFTGSYAAITWLLWLVIVLAVVVLRPGEGDR